MRQPKLLAIIGLFLALTLGSACGSPEQKLAAGRTDQILFQREAAARAGAGAEYREKEALAAAVVAKANQDAAAHLAELQREAAARKAREQVAARASQKASRSGTVPRGGGAPVDVGGDVWGALARCESGGNPRAVGGGGRYFGAFQFTIGTWHSLGMSGNPVDHDFGTQLAAAQRLVARSGWGQFPHCSRLLGLR